MISMQKSGGGELMTCAYAEAGLCSLGCEIALR